MLRGIDHLVIVVPDLGAAVKTYRDLGFTVVAGGRHPGVGTDNALIAFRDSSYLELVGFHEPRPDHRWWAPLQKGGGLVDFCLQTDDLAGDAGAFRRAGVDMGDLERRHRTRPDGVEVRWLCTLARGAHRGVAPFLLAEESGRDARVPGQRAHANGVTGVDIFLSTDGGATFDQVVAENVPNTGTYNWSVSDEPTTQARIRVVAQDANFQEAADASDADFTITINVTDVPPAAVPDKAFLGATVPEPFVDRTDVRFGLAQPGPVTLSVYSVEGRVIRELRAGQMGAGTFDASWDGRDAAGNAVTSGRYFLRLTTPEGTLTRNITLMR